MTKLIISIRNICSLLIIIFVSLNIFYLAWVFLAKNIYWSLYSDVANTLMWPLFLGFFLFIPILAISNLKPALRLATFVMAIALFCLEFGIIRNVPSYLNSRLVNDKTIILGKYGSENGSTCYQLLECKANSTYCEQTKPRLSDCASSSFEPNTMLVDDTGNLSIYINGILVYTYGTNSQYFTKARNWRSLRQFCAGERNLRKVFVIY